MRGRKHSQLVPSPNIPQVMSDVMGECALMQTGPEQQKVSRQDETFPPNTAHLQAPCCTHTCCAAPTPPHTRARERRHPRPASKHSSGRLSFQLFLPFISRLDSIFSSMPPPALFLLAALFRVSLNWGVCPSH